MRDTEPRVLRLSAGLRLWALNCGTGFAAPEVFAALNPDPAQPAVWLDSARQAYGTGRWSIISAAARAPGENPPPTGFGAQPRVLSAAGGGAAAEQLLNQLERSITEAAIDQEQLRLEFAAAGIPELPFVGGYIGYFGYEFKHFGARASGAAGDGEHGGSAGSAAGDDAQLMWVDAFAVIDHAQGNRLWLCAAVPAAEHTDATAAPDAEWRAWLTQQRALLEAAREAAHAAAETAGAPAALPDPQPRRTAWASVSRAQYLEHIATVRGWLYAGDSYEACYTYQLRVPAPALPGQELYGLLREHNPAPYGAYLRLGRKEVLSSSPERFLRLDRDRQISCKPIKGTLPRAADAAEDAARAQELAADPKNRAENLMIVDLLRNDLGRICETGSVAVPQLMTVESYQSVHQLVSTVTGRLCAGVGFAEMFRALFPGGSMTGAPKVRTVELLDQLEPVQRGVYSGALGYVSLCGAADLSIVIRAAVLEGGIASVGCGGAITVLSDPAAEWQETVVKAAPLLQVLGAAHPDSVPE